MLMPRYHLNFNFHLYLAMLHNLYNNAVYIELECTENILIPSKEPRTSIIFEKTNSCNRDFYCVFTVLVLLVLCTHTMESNLRPLEF